MALKNTALKILVSALFFPVFAQASGVNFPTDEQLNSVQLPPMPNQAQLDEATERAKQSINQSIGVKNAEGVAVDAMSAKSGPIPTPPSRLDKAVESVGKAKQTNLPKPLNNPKGIDLSLMAEKFESLTKQKSKPEAGKDVVDRLLVFVSSSMPKDRVVKIVNDTTALGGVVVLRGTVDNQISFNATRLWVESLELKNGGGIIINPNLFKAYSIETVPTFVVADPEKAAQLNAEGCSPTYSYASMAGDVSLLFALNRIKEKSENKDAVKMAQNFLDQMKKK